MASGLANQIPRKWNSHYRMRCTSFFVGAASCFNDLGVNRELTTPVLSPSHVCESDTTDVNSPSSNAPIAPICNFCWTDMPPKSFVTLICPLSLKLRKEARIRTITLIIFFTRNAHSHPYDKLWTSGKSQKHSATAQCQA